jgi:hypothetical protein
MRSSACTSPAYKRHFCDCGNLNFATRGLVIKVFDCYRPVRAVKFASVWQHEPRVALLHRHIEIRAGKRLIAQREMPLRGAFFAIATLALAVVLQTLVFSASPQIDANAEPSFQTVPDLLSERAQSTEDSKTAG